MRFNHIIAENLGFIQWLLTWLILVGMVIAGYYLVPMALNSVNEATPPEWTTSVVSALPLAPLILITMTGAGLIALIWQFRIIQKEK